MHQTHGFVSNVLKANMSGLNVSLGYLLAVIIVSVFCRRLLTLQPILYFSAEFTASFMLVACWLEVQTLIEVGQWLGGFGPDVAAIALFLVLMVHGVASRSATGNPLVTQMEFMLCQASAFSTLTSFAGQIVGAYIARLLTHYYWSIHLSQAHMIKSLMLQDCSPALRVSVFQGTFTEAVCALAFHLLYFNFRGSSTLFKVPLIALLRTFLFYAASGYTSGFINPSLAYALTFHCPGFTFLEYMTVFWLGPIAGMTVAVFLYMGHIPRLSSRNLLYSQKTRFRVPKWKTAQNQNVNEKKS